MERAPYRAPGSRVVYVRGGVEYTGTVVCGWTLADCPSIGGYTIRPDAEPRETVDILDERIR